MIIAALIGAGGLGPGDRVRADEERDRPGVAGGLAIVLLAIVLDRITQAWGTDPRAESDGKQTAEISTRGRYMRITIHSVQLAAHATPRRHRWSLAVPAAAAAKQLRPTAG